MSNKYHDFSEFGQPIKKANGEILLDKNGKEEIVKSLGMPALLVSVDEGETKNGSIFCKLTLRSLYSKQEIVANKWETSRVKLLDKFQEGEPLWVELDMQLFNGNPSFVVKNKLDTAPEDVKKEDFLITPPYDPAVMVTKEMEMLQKVLDKDPSYAPAKIALKLYENNQEKLNFWSAAKSIHHNIYGGLSYHNYRQMVMASYLGKVGEKVFGKAENISNDVEAFLLSFDGEITQLLIKAAKGDNAFGKQYSLNTKTERALLYAKLMLAKCISSLYKGMDLDVLSAALLIDQVPTMMGEMLSHNFESILLVDTLLGDIDVEKKMLIKHVVSGKTPAVAEAQAFAFINNVAYAVANTNPDYNMILSAAAIHDIGKLIELETDAMGNADYTIEGALLGHLIIGAEMVCKTIEENPEFNIPDKYDLLHCILSHHEKEEWGAVVAPKTTEAELLSQLDYLDSRMYIFEQSDSVTEVGALNDKTSFALGTKAYRPTFR